MGGGDGDRDRALLGQSLARLPRSAPSALHSFAISHIKAAIIGRLIVFFKPALRHDSERLRLDRICGAERRSNLGRVRLAAYLTCPASPRTQEHCRPYN